MKHIFAEISMKIERTHILHEMRENLKVLAEENQVHAKKKHNHQKKLQKYNS